MSAWMSWSRHTTHTLVSGTTRYQVCKKRNTGGVSINSWYVYMILRFDLFRTFEKKGCTRQKHWQKGELFADGDVHVIRQIDSKSISAAFVVLPGLLPTIHFFLVYSGWTRVIKSGVWPSTLLGMLAQGFTPPSLLPLGSPPFGHDFTPFWHVADWCAPDWLKNTADWRLF